MKRTMDTLQGTILVCFGQWLREHDADLRALEKTLRDVMTSYALLDADVAPALEGASAPPIGAAAWDVLRQRAHQIATHYHPTNDDKLWCDWEEAAIHYVLPTGVARRAIEPFLTLPRHLDPAKRREELVVAGAMIIAAIERMDQKAAT
jgi:hypothetical protein